MVKRKAETVDENVNGRAIRRSGRHKSSNEEPNSTKSTGESAQKLSKRKKATEKGIGTKDPQNPANIQEIPKAEDIAKLPLQSNEGEKQYWLMKAEPESRLEKGHDVKFSIDDLASKVKPEPWDGIRNPVARNNLRAMKKGDLAFFYHSSCKIPAIVGIMEVVQEHSPDLSAQDPKAPYYDPRDDDPSKPKWSVVHVKFRSKLKEPITLKELREFGEKGKPLEGMQMLKQSRLSVSKVSKTEWEYLMGIVEENGATE